MRIARILTRLNLGGPARQVLASDPRLVAAGHAVRIYAGQPEPGEGDLFDEARARGLDVVRIPSLGRGLRPTRDLFAWRALREELRRFRPDVVHTHASKAGVLGRRAARAVPDAARVHTFHGHVLEGYFAGPLARQLIAMETRLARETDRIVAVSHATAEDLLRLGVASEQQLVVVPPGVEMDALLALPAHAPPAQRGALRGAIGVSSETFVVGIIGRLAEVKRPELALEVFELLRARRPELALVFAGDGPERRALERRIAALPAEDARRVHLLGARADVAEVLSGLDAVLLCSRSEGLPVSLIEAAAAGLPAVATDVGGVSEVVAHERTGFLGTNAAELAHGLDQLIADRELGRAMGARARLRVRERHAPERLAATLEAIYREVAGARACVS